MKWSECEELIRQDNPQATKRQTVGWGKSS